MRTFGEPSSKGYAAIDNGLSVAPYAAGCGFSSVGAQPWGLSA